MNGKGITQNKKEKKKKEKHVDVMHDTCSINKFQCL